MAAVLQRIFNDLQFRLETDDGRVATGLMNVIHTLRCAPIPDQRHRMILNDLEALAVVYPPPSYISPHADAETHGVYCSILNELHPWLFVHGLPQGIQHITDSLESVPSPEEDGAASDQEIPDAVDNVHPRVTDAPHLVPTPPIVRALLAARAISARRNEDAIMEAALQEGVAADPYCEEGRTYPHMASNGSTTVAVTVLIKIQGHPDLSRMHTEHIFVPEGAPSPTVEIQIGNGTLVSQAPCLHTVAEGESHNLAMAEGRPTQPDSEI